jgi:hypothetical protein
MLRNLVTTASQPLSELTFRAVLLDINERSTYVAFTSSFAGTGGIVDAEADAEAMMGVVACSGALFEGDFLRERNPIFVVVQGKAWFCWIPDRSVLG